MFPESLLKVLELGSHESESNGFEFERGQTLESRPGCEGGERHPVAIELIGRWTAQHGVEDV